MYELKTATKMFIGRLVFLIFIFYMLLIQIQWHSKTHYICIKVFKKIFLYMHI